MGLVFGISLAFALIGTTGGLLISSWSSLSLLQAEQPNSSSVQNSISVQDYDKLKNCTNDLSKRPTSIEYLTHFNCGNVSTESNGAVNREFTLFGEENQEIPISDIGHVADAWTFNGTIPGPTMSH